MSSFDISGFTAEINISGKNKKAPVYFTPESAGEILGGRKVCAFTGYRPEKTGYTGENDIRCAELKKKLRTEIRNAAKESFTVFLTGMALGTDTWAAEEVIEEARMADTEISLYAAVPSPCQSDYWLDWERERYSELLSDCAGVFVISEKNAPGCIRKRNEFLVKHASLLIAVYDGKKGGTAQTLGLAEKAGVRTVIIQP